MRKSRPMKTAATAGSAGGPQVKRPRGGPTVSGQWWKVWVLLTSLGATVLGWVAYSTGEPPVESVVVAPVTTPIGVRGLAAFSGEEGRARSMPRASTAAA
jgi:hypothetical protein